MTAVDDFFDEPSLAGARQLIANAGEADLERQVQYVREAFYARLTATDVDTTLLPVGTAKAGTSVSQAMLLEAARAPLGVRFPGE